MDDLTWGDILFQREIGRARITVSVINDIDCWSRLGLVGTLVFSGIEIARVTLYGYEPEDTDYIRSDAREVARQTIIRAKEWLDDACGRHKKEVPA